MLRTLLVSALAVCLSFCLVAGCSKRDEHNAAALQLNWKAEPQFGGFYAAIEKAKEKGITLDVRAGGASAPTIELLGAGKVPFAIVSADEIPRAREQGIHVVALFATYQTHPQGLLTQSKRRLKSIDDVFKSTGTLAIEAGLPYSDFLKKKYGFNDLKIVPSPGGDLSLLRTNDTYAMQCFVTSEPLAAKKAGIDVTVFPIADSGYNPYATVLATTDEYRAAHPDQVAAITAAVKAGWEAYLKDPTATNAQMHALNPTMDEATFTESAAAQKPLIEGGDASTLGAGAMTLARWTTLVDQLRELGVIKGDVKSGDCFAGRDK